MLRMLAFSLVFCTEIDRPALSSVTPRCCSKAFIGTTKKPPTTPSSAVSTTAACQLSMPTIKGISTPSKIPTAKTRGACSKRTQRTANAAPATTPTAVAACR